MIKETINSTSKRIQSLDALRGFDMFWIIGGQKLVYALAVTTNLAFFKWLNGQMKHLPWNGFTFYDLIFPLFLFLAGVSMPYSFEKRLKQSSKSKVYQHALKRMVFLIVLGWVYNGIMDLDFDSMRYGSVLGRIGIAWFLAAILYLNFKEKQLIIWFFGLLISYTLLLLFVPVPGFGPGVITPEGNLAGYIDRLFFPGRFYFENVFEPQGILTTVPSVGTALLGVFAGLYLKKNEANHSYRSFFVFMVIGILCLVFGEIWALALPINKWLWTSSFVLYAGGWSFILLAIFYLLFDIWKLRRLAFFFMVIGVNPITIYLVQHKIINFHVTRDFLFGGFVEKAPEALGPIVGAIGYIFCTWIFLYFLFRNRIFLKV